MRAFKNGALEFNGIANVEPVGECLGTVNFYQFDSVASVVETSGFLDLSEDDDGDCVSTVGNTIIEIQFVDGPTRTFTRDAMNEPPIFWAVSRLTESLLDLAKWGREVYDSAESSFAARDGG